MKPRMSLSSMFKWFYAPVAHRQEIRTGSICGEKEFLRVLARERARAGRSTHQFSLVVFETENGKLGTRTVQNP